MSRSRQGGVEISSGAQFSALFDGHSFSTLLRADVLVFLGLSAALTVALPLLSPVAASMLTFAAMLPPFYLAWGLPLPPPLVPMEYTLLTIVMLFAVNVLVSYFIETHERQKLIAAFGQYVPPALVAEINRNPLAFSMAGQAQMVQVRADCARCGWPELTIGIGINSGMMNVGNMGSRFRVAYTVLGDAVNLAARLEALTRFATLRDSAVAPAYYEVMLVRMHDRERPPDWDGIVNFGGEFSYSLELPESGF